MYLYIYLVCTLFNLVIKFSIDYIDSLIKHRLKKIELKQQYNQDSLPEQHGVPLSDYLRSVSDKHPSLPGQSSCSLNRKNDGTVSSTDFEFVAFVFSL